MKFQRFLILFFLTLSGAVSQELSSPSVNFSSKELKELRDGKSVLRVIDKEGYVWPEVQVYRKVKASPSLLINLFLDYEAAPDYIPHLLSAKVKASAQGGHLKDVLYTVKLPVLFKVSYLIRNHYTFLGNDCYRVDWNLLRSAFAKSAVGSLRVEPYQVALGESSALNSEQPAEFSLMSYSNHVEPATRLVASLRGQAEKEALKTVEAIVKEAEARQSREDSQRQ